jgi:phage recombination protein Bet
LNAQVKVTTPSGRSIVADMATRYGMQPEAFERTLRATVFPAEASREQFAAFLLVAREYNLNPLTKQIFAFPDKRGGIIIIVGVDGYLAVINSKPEFDGMEFVDQLQDGQLVAVTCKIYRKDRSHAVEITEYMGECKRDTDTWRKWPARMLRHKAAIQAARYAFGLCGVVDEDEAGRIIEAQSNETIDRETGEIKTKPSAIEQVKEALAKRNGKPKAAEAEKSEPERPDLELTPSTPLDLTLRAINEAQSVEDLLEVAATAGKLEEADKIVARAAYQRKQDDLDRPNR